jgi:hypothetical protein
MVAAVETQAISKSKLDYKSENTCFFIFPASERHSRIGKRADAVFHNIVEPAAAVSGLNCVRSDGVSAPDTITTQVVSHVINDRIVIADLSGHDPTVSYGLGLRHAFRKPVVQLLAFDEKSPFNVQGVRTIKYELSSAESIQAAREAVQQQIAAAMSPVLDVDSPVTIAATIEQLAQNSSPQVQAMFRTIYDKVAGLDKSVVELLSSGLLASPDQLKELIRSAFEIRADNLLEKFADQLDLLKSVKEAGLIAVEKGREMAFKNFARDLDEELSEIMVVGSSLKGLLQKGEFGEIAEKLRFKLERRVSVRFLLTHPIVADFRGSQENRAPTEIGLDIIASLKILRFWNVDPKCVRLYIGPPTCFAITTSRRMVINPYLSTGATYDSPCLVLDRSGYLFEQFKALHFGAWDTGLAVPIRSFDDAIARCEAMLSTYATDVSTLVSKGRSDASGK